MGARDNKNTQIKYLILLHILLCLYSVGGIFSKLASRQEFLSKEFIFYYGIVLVNLFVYALLWQQILKKLSLVTAFSNKSVIVIWGALWGCLFFDELISFGKILGIVLVVIGIYIVTTDKEE